MLAFYWSSIPWFKEEHLYVLDQIKSKPTKWMMIFSRGRTILYFAAPSKLLYPLVCWSVRWSVSSLKYSPFSWNLWKRAGYCHCHWSVFHAPFHFFSFSEFACFWCGRQHSKIELGSIRHTQSVQTTFEKWIRLLSFTGLILIAKLYIVGSVTSVLLPTLVYYFSKAVSNIAIMKIVVPFGSNPSRLKVYGIPFPYLVDLHFKLRTHTK